MSAASLGYAETRKVDSPMVHHVIETPKAFCCSIHDRRRITNHFGNVLNDYIRRTNDFSEPCHPIIETVSRVFSACVIVQATVTLARRSANDQVDSAQTVL